MFYPGIFILTSLMLLVVRSNCLIKLKRSAPKQLYRTHLLHERLALGLLTTGIRIEFSFRSEHHFSTTNKQRISQLHCKKNII